MRKYRVRWASLIPATTGDADQLIDWDGSEDYGSSEPMDSIAELGVDLDADVQL